MKSKVNMSRKQIRSQIEISDLNEVDMKRLQKVRTSCLSDILSEPTLKATLNTAPTEELIEGVCLLLFYDLKAQLAIIHVQGQKVVSAK